MTQAIIGSGTLLQIETATPGTFSTIAELTNIATNPKYTEFDVTSHDSSNKYREFKPGLREAEVLFDGFYLATNTTHNANSDTGLVGVLNAKTLKIFKLIFPDTNVTEYQFKGYIRSIAYSSNVDDILSFSAELRVSDLVSFITNDASVFGLATFGDSEFSSET